MQDFVRFIKKQYFWMVVPIVLGLTAFAWWSASSDLSKRFNDGKSTIDSKFQAMSSVSSKSSHPNKTFHEQMELLIKSRAQDVAKAWELQYEKQVSTMQWSPLLRKEGPDFLQAVTNLRPIESVSSDVKLKPWMLDTYRDFIVKDELKRLADIIGSKWVVAENDGGMGVGGGYGAAGGYGAPSGMAMGAGYGPPSGADAAGGGYGMPSGYGGGGGYSGGGGEDWDEADGVNPNIVKWDPANQQKIQATSFGWSLRGSGQPTVREMLYSQEDVWVLDSLMQIIKETNGDATHSSQAVIKEINAIDIGKTVNGPKGKVSAVQSATAEEEDGFGMDGMISSAGGGDGYGDYDAYADMGMEDDEGGGMPSGPDPAENRYVTENFEPITADDLLSAAESEDLEQISVAKRMPVRMRIKMDSRKIPSLLAACANAPLTFEVQQIRVNPGQSDESVLGGGMGGGGYGMPSGYGAPGMGYGAPSGSSDEGVGPPGGAGGGYGMPSGYGAPGMGGGGGGYGGYGMGMEEDDPNKESFDKTVELFGIIYIYNPVDRKKLGLDQEGENDQPTVARTSPADRR